MSRGLVLGKFLPPHTGHLYLVDFACSYADDVTVVVGSLAREPIPGAVRHAWMTECCPRARVVHLDRELPQEPAEHPDFWRLWREALRDVLPGPVDLVFASEAYGFELARQLDAAYVPVDHARELMPVSGTAVRADPYGHWRFLPPPVRAHYARRVSLFGGESTGKTTLAAALAHHYGTVWVHEYARPLLALHGDQVVAADLERIRRGQVASEDALARRCERVLICDTDPLLTEVWGEALFDEPALAGPWGPVAAARRYDLTLLCAPDTPWVDDAQRFLPERRGWFHDRCVDVLRAAGRPYVELRGGWDERLAAAVAAIDALLR